jgi:hypothetical protein
VERVETGYQHLNRLLNNEKLNDRPGFFDYLRQKDYLNAYITLYNFLKQERMEAPWHGGPTPWHGGPINESDSNRELAEGLTQIERNVEELISKII